MHTQHKLINLIRIETLDATAERPQLLKCKECVIVHVNHALEYMVSVSETFSQTITFNIKFSS